MNISVVVRLTFKSILSDGKSDGKSDSRCDSQIFFL